MTPQIIERNKPIDSKLAKAIYKEAETPQKPWTIATKVSNNSGTEFDEALDVLRTLTHRGVLTPTANGDIRQYASSFDEY